MGPVMTVRLPPIFTLFCCLLTTTVARAETPPLLATAMQKLVNEDDQWAYTQVIRRTDREGGDTVARFDPTKPQGEKWELIKLKGKAPTNAEADRWCRRRGGEVSQTDGRALTDLLDLEHASIASETPTSVRFKVPLKKNVIARVPTENFIAFAEIDRGDESIQRFSIFLRQSVRLIGGAAEIQSAQGVVTFQAVDETACMRPAKIVASGTGQALFKKVNRSAEIIYTNQRRVKS